MLERQAEHDRLLNAELHLEKGPEDSEEPCLESELRTPEVRQYDQAIAPLIRLSEFRSPGKIIIALRLLFARPLYAFIPQLIRTKGFDDPLITEPLHSTSWLTGLRGIAAMMVFNRHYSAPFTLTTYVGYGATATDTWVHQLPVFEMLYDGLLGVVIFFTISGYVCSVKSLRAMAEGDSILRSLPASAFGRWFRLYLPVICSTFLIFSLFRIGAMNPARAFLEDFDDPKLFPGRPPLGLAERYPPDMPQFSHWLVAMFEITNPWTLDPENLLNRYLWTIVEEYRSSMTLYISLIVLSICRSWTRLPILVLLGAIFAGPWQHWPPLAFFAGATLAQMDVSRAMRATAKASRSHGCHDLSIADDADDDDVSVLKRGRGHNEGASSLASLWLLLRSPFPRSFRRFYDSYKHCVLTSCRLTLYLLAFYLMSYPRQELKQPSPLYKAIVSPLIPRTYTNSTGPAFPKQIGVFVFMCLISSIPTNARQRSLWHHCLTSSICQHLGRISFATYLLHGPTNWILGYVLPHLLWRQWQPSNASWEYAVPESLPAYLVGLFVGWLVTLVIVMWVADIWTREVEWRCIRFTKWLQSGICVAG